MQTRVQFDVKYTYWQFFLGFFLQLIVQLGKLSLQCQLTSSFIIAV